MKECVPSIGKLLIPLVLCANAAARIPWVSRLAFSNHTLSSCCRGRDKGGSARKSPTASSAGLAAASRRRLPGKSYAGMIMTSSLRGTEATFRVKSAFRAGFAVAYSSVSGDHVGMAVDAGADDDLDARVKTAVAQLPQRPRCAVIGGGFAGLATAYHLAAFGSDVTVFDPHEVGTGGASAVAAGLLHPLTPRGKLIWKGEEGFRAAKDLIEVANAGLAQGPIDEAGMETKAQQSASDSSLPQDCLTTGKVYRPLMDEKHFDLFSKAAEVLPQWVEKLSREEYLKLVPGGDDSCLGGVCIKGALAVDAPFYLKGLWASIRTAVAVGRKTNSDRVDRIEGAQWVRQGVDDIHALETSGEFNAVVACVGAGVRVLAGVQDIVSLRLVRGQSLIYDNVASLAAREGGVSTTAQGGGPSRSGGEEKLLTSGVLCGQYVVPTSVDGGTRGNGGKLLCGSTQEPVLSWDKVDKPPDMAKAMRQLAPKVAKFFPALDGVEPLGVTSGVRVIQDRNSYGRIPIAGRLPFSKHGWVIAALGARGLIHHAYLGRLVAASALLGSDEPLPPQVMAPLEDLGKDSTGDL